MKNYTESELETLISKGSKKNTRYFFLGEKIEKSTWKKLYEVRTTMRYGTPQERMHREEERAEQRERAMKNLFAAAHSALTALGYTVEHTSGASVYYLKDSNRVRVSGHEVPMTDEREHNEANGFFSWAGKGIVLHHTMDAEELKNDLQKTYGDGE